MTCEKLAKLLVPYVDEKVSATERREVESHLVNCADCRTRVEEYGSLSNVLNELPRIQPSFGFDARLRARIASDAHPNWLSWLAPSPRLTFAMAILLAVSIFVVVRPAGVSTVKPLSPENQFQMINNLPVLEDYDVVSNFDALSDLPLQQNPASNKTDSRQKNTGAGRI